MADKPLIAFLATYDEADDARRDFDEIRQAHGKGFIGNYDAAIVWRNAKGKVQVDSVSDEASRKWVWAGLGVGALVGLIFPPSIIASAAIGALGGAVIGRFRDGIPQKDLDDVGDALTGDNAAIVVIAEERVTDALAQLGATLDASKKQIEVTLSPNSALAAEQLRDAVKQAAVQLEELTQADADRQKTQGAR